MFKKFFICFFVLHQINFFWGKTELQLYEWFFLICAIVFTVVFIKKEFLEKKEPKD